MAKKEVRVDEATQREVYKIIDLMSDYIGVRLNRKKYPVVQVDEGAGAAYNPRENVIRLPYEVGDSDYDSFAVAEEVSHFIRRKTRPFFTLRNDRRQREGYTDEFFGFLGKMIYNKIIGGEKKLEHDMDNDMVLKYLRENRRLNRENEEVYKKKGDLSEEEVAIRDEVYLINSMKLEAGRKHVLKHARPFRFASETDLEKINELSGIYGLSDRDVRKRFFREDKQYDLSSKPAEAKVKRKGGKSRKNEESVKRGGLEEAVGFVSFIFILLSVFLFGFNLTGGVIGSVNNELSVLGFFLLIAGILGFLISNRFNKRKNG